MIEGRPRPGKSRDTIPAPRGWSAAPTTLFEAADRMELAAVEKQEIVVIKEFLPQALSKAEVEEIVREAIAKTGANSMKDMGKVMGLVRPQVVGRVDMAAVRGKIKTLLA